MNLKKLILPLVLFLIGFAVFLLASLFKIMHWVFASELLIISMAVMVIGIFILVVKLIQFSRNP